MLTFIGSFVTLSISISLKFLFMIRIGAKKPIDITDIANYKFNVSKFCVLFYLVYLIFYFESKACTSLVN